MFMQVHQKRGDSFCNGQRLSGLHLKSSWEAMKFWNSNHTSATGTSDILQNFGHQH